MVLVRWESDLIIFSECSRMRHGGTGGRNIVLVDCLWTQKKRGEMLRSFLKLISDY